MIGRDGGLALLLLLAAGCAPAWGQAAAPVPAPGLLDAAGFLRAGPGRSLDLPADHGSHPETSTEWWYLTGPLTAEDGSRYGFQATWFRRALVRDALPRESPLGTRDVLMFHGALTDLGAGRFEHTEAASRAAPPWAVAATERLSVHVFEHQLEGDGERARLTFGVGGRRLELELDLAASPVLRHGEEPGLSLKGGAPGQASWYFSLPAIPVQGRLVGVDGRSLVVEGRAWMDHEFGGSALGADQVGWDWFSATLDDGTALMVYVLRHADGRVDPASSGTLMSPDGVVRHLASDAFVVRATGAWTSPHSGVTYPAGWRLEVPAAGLALDVRPALADQELRTTWTGVTYWEGLCRFGGTHGGRPVTGEGYVELVGHGASIADRFAPADG